MRQTEVETRGRWSGEWNVVHDDSRSSPVESCRSGHICLLIQCRIYIRGFGFLFTDSCARGTRLEYPDTALISTEALSTLYITYRVYRAGAHLKLVLIKLNLIEYIISFRNNCLLFIHARDVNSLKCDCLGPHSPSDQTGNLFGHSWLH